MAKELYKTGLLNDANLQGYWRLEDANDSGPNGYNLQQPVGITFSAGKFGNGVDIENSGGEDNYLDIADASCANLEIASDQTWGAWVKLESYTGNERIMCKYTAGTDKQLYVTGTQKFSFYLGGLTTSVQSISTTTASTGSWFFVVGVYDSSNTALQIWVNGVKETEETASGSATDTNGAFAIGRRGNADSNYFDGIIDDAFIFNRALTEAEIKALYYGGKNYGVVI